ncbi:hypothetical protein D3C72_1880060 [compost metagenome]
MSTTAIRKTRCTAMTTAGTGGRLPVPSGASTPPPVPTERSSSALRQTKVNRPAFRQTATAARQPKCCTMKVESQPNVVATIKTGGAA